MYAIIIICIWINCLNKLSKLFWRFRNICEAFSKYSIEIKSNLEEEPLIKSKIKSVEVSSNVVCYQPSGKRLSPLLTTQLLANYILMRLKLLQCTLNFSLFMRAKSDYLFGGFYFESNIFPLDISKTFL